jgi:hypothetical protein
MCVNMDHVTHFNALPGATQESDGRTVLWGSGENDIGLHVHETYEEVVGMLKLALSGAARGRDGK